MLKDTLITYDNKKNEKYIKIIMFLKDIITKDNKSRK
jgi:hypothetical protein